MHKSGALFQDSWFTEVGHCLKRDPLSPATSETPGPALCPFSGRIMMVSLPIPCASDSVSIRVITSSIQGPHWKGKTVPQSTASKMVWAVTMLCRPCSPLDHSLESVAGPQQFKLPCDPHDLPPQPQLPRTHRTKGSGLQPGLWVRPPRL